MTPAFRSSKTCAWNSPRPSAGSDADRFRTYGPLQPLDDRPVSWRVKAALVLFWAGLAAAAGWRLL